MDKFRDREKLLHGGMLLLEIKGFERVVQGRRCCMEVRLGVREKITL